MVFQNVKISFKNVHLNVKIYWISTTTLWNSKTVNMLFQVMVKMNCKILHTAMEPLKKILKIWTNFSVETAENSVKMKNITKVIDITINILQMVHVLLAKNAILKSQKSCFQDIWKECTKRIKLFAKMSVKYGILVSSAKLRIQL